MFPAFEVYIPTALGTCSVGGLLQAKHIKIWDHFLSNKLCLSPLKKICTIDVSGTQSLWNVYERWSESCLVMSNSLQPHGLHSPWNSPGPNTGVGSLSLLHGIFLTQGSNPGLPHCRRILYQLSHKGSPRILEWVAYSFSSRSSQPRNQIRLSFIASGFFTNWAVRGAQGYSKFSININWLV